MNLTTLPLHLEPPQTIADLCDRLATLAQDYYQSPPDPKGRRQPTGEAENVRIVLNAFKSMASDCHPHKIDARVIYQFQQYLLERRTKGGKRLKRYTVNKYLATLRRVLKAVAHPVLNWVPPEAITAFEVVQSLPYGRTDAPESQPVGPVTLENVTSTMAVIPQWQMHLYLMLDLHWHTGMRPGELVRMQRSEIVIERARLATGAEVELMVYKPWHHKTRYRGHDRNIFLSPEARRIVEDRLARMDSCPSATEALWPYSTTGSYREAIIRLNARNQLPYWTPNQIRHSFATRMRAASGIDVVQVLMGHRARSTTEIYAKPDASAAIEAILKFG